VASEIVWSLDSVNALEEIVSYIQKDSFHYAAIFTEEILDLIEMAAAHPDAGRIVPEIDDPAVREFCIDCVSLM